VVPAFCRLSPLCASPTGFSSDRCYKFAISLGITPTDLDQPRTENLRIIFPFTLSAAPPRLSIFPRVTKHHNSRTGPKHRSFCDLFTSISNILQQQQPACMAVPKCINRRLHCAFEQFFKMNICFGAGMDGTVGGKSLIAVALSFKSHRN